MSEAERENLSADPEFEESKATSDVEAHLKQDGESEDEVEAHGGKYW